MQQMANISTNAWRKTKDIENLLKKQISVNTSVINNFNNTIQKLQLDEVTFNKDVEHKKTFNNEHISSSKDSGLM